LAIGLDFLLLEPELELELEDFDFDLDFDFDMGFDFGETCKSANDNLSIIYIY
jgi:hypothetical protein